MLKPKQDATKKLANHPAQLRAVLRSVLLAQGEFAAFLSGQKHEKGLLLQQIAGDRKYTAKLEKHSGTGFRSKENKLEQIKSRINTDDLLSREVTEQLDEKKSGWLKTRKNLTTS